MDLLRSCYEVDMQFDTAGQIIRRVRWYWADAGAEFFPVRHQFGSQNYSQTGVVLTGLGERWDSERLGRNGSIEGIRQGVGSFCGPLSWYQEGCPSDAPSLELGPLGVPLCCNPRQGAYAGATSSVRLYPPNTGGVSAGGNSTLRYGDGTFGGILTGGSSSLALVYPTTGGVNVGALSEVATVYPAIGGVEVGAEATVSIISEVAGGPQVGGTSLVNLEIPVMGGAKAGGTVSYGSHICNPCGILLPDIIHYTLTNLTGGLTCLSSIANIPLPMSFIGIGTWRSGQSHTPCAIPNPVGTGIMQVQFACGASPQSPRFSLTSFCNLLVNFGPTLADTCTPFTFSLRIGFLAGQGAPTGTVDITFTV